MDIYTYQVILLKEKTSNMNFVENGVMDDVVVGSEVANKRRNDMRCVRFVFGEENDNYNEV